jgi:hypothetical protein
MGLRVDYSYDRENYVGAYVNIHVIDTQKINNQWKMVMVINIWTPNKKLRIHTIYETQVDHVPGQCIHEECYAYIKTMPNFTIAIDEI